MSNRGFNATEKVLLYYPTIDIPSPSWIRQGIMYWDRIGSIVPNSYDRHLPRSLRYSKQIQPLYDAGLFQPFNPVDLFEADGWKGEIYQSFSEELLAKLRSKDFKRRLKKKPKFDIPLYKEKIIDTLYRLELEGKYAERRDDGFYYFEKNTAFVYLSVLAKYLANIDTQLTIPSTDLKIYEELNFKATPKEQSPIPCLQVEFKDLLRVPSDDVEIERIIEFRQTRSDELKNFRQKILDKFEDDIKKCEDAKEIKSKTIGFKNQVNKGVEDLDKMLNETNFQIVRGTLKTIFKAPHITNALLAATAAGGTTGSAKIAGLTGIAGFAGSASIEIYDYYASGKNAKQKRLGEDAYSYLYLAEKEFKEPKDS